MKKRAILYARKSQRVEGGQSKSVTDQLDDCRRYAEAMGWAVVAELRDDGYSASTLPWHKRPEFGQAMEFFERGEAEVFVTLWTSRLSRDEEDRKALPRMLAAYGAEWHAVDDGGLIETDTYDGFVRDTVRYLFDVGESKRKSEMWKATQRRRVEKGLPKGGQVRFGYVKGENGVQTPDPVTGDVLRSLYLRYAQGAGFQALVKDLNDRAVRTMKGNEWDVQSLIRALDSGWGAGLIMHERGKRFTKGAHEPVITEAEWKSYVRTREKAKKGPRKSANPRWFLTGLVVCGKCGGRAVVNSNRRRSVGRSG